MLVGDNNNAFDKNIDKQSFRLFNDIDSNN